jgi:hypothetical protein
MSNVVAAPETMAAAATDLDSVGSMISEAHTTAAPPTVALVPAAADEVSAATAKLFGGYAQEFHAVSAQAAAFHEQFVEHLRTSAGSYAGAEAANVASLQPSTGIVGSIFDTLDVAFKGFLVKVLENVVIPLSSTVAGRLLLLSSSPLIALLIPLLIGVYLFAFLWLFALYVTSGSV